MMYVLGVDIGTTGTKTMLVSEKGEICKTHYMAYPLITKANGYVEQNACDWWKTTVITIKKCIEDLENKSSVKAISLSTQGGSMLLCDGRGEPISNAIVWIDTRGSECLEQLARLKDEEYYYKTTGWKLNAALFLSKLMWLKKNDPESLKKSKMIFSTIDFVNFKLTGKRVIDHTSGAITQLMNIHTCEWEDELLQICGIDKSYLSQIEGSGKAVGKLCSKAAEELGLSQDVIIIGGAHDQYVAAAGAGAMSCGDVVLSTGTAWVVLGMTDKPVLNIANPMTCGPHVVPGIFGSLATVTTAGAAFEWFRNRFAPARLENGELTLDTYSEIDIKASERYDKTKNLLFVPYFSGKKFPIWNEKIKACILGLNLDNDFYDIMLSIMEGVAFDARYILEGYENLSGEVKQLCLLGGASKSTLWTDIVSSVTKRPIIRFQEANMACVGAACLAGCGIGMFDSLRAASSLIAKYEKIESFNIGKVEYYEEKYRKFLSVIQTLNSYYD